MKNRAAPFDQQIERNLPFPFVFKIIDVLRAFFEIDSPLELFKMKDKNEHLVESERSVLSLGEICPPVGKKRAK